LEALKARIESMRDAGDVLVRANILQEQHYMIVAGRIDERYRMLKNFLKNQMLKNKIAMVGIASDNSMDRQSEVMPLSASPSLR
jgi:uncharacterized protein (UPF0128 family)